MACRLWKVDPSRRESLDTSRGAAEHRSCVFVWDANCKRHTNSLRRKRKQDHNKCSLLVPVMQYLSQSLSHLMVDEAPRSVDDEELQKHQALSDCDSRKCAHCKMSWTHSTSQTEQHTHLQPVVRRARTNRYTVAMRRPVQLALLALHAGTAVVAFFQPSLVMSRRQQHAVTPGDNNVHWT